MSLPMVCESAKDCIIERVSCYFCDPRIHFEKFLLYTEEFAQHIAGNESGDAKCREKERQALLNFKQSLIDYYGILSTWTNHQNNTDCCKWKGIQCNIQTGHVILLDLRSLNTQYLRGPINLTSLIQLQYIQHLDLSNNDFLWNLIPSTIGSFTNLQYLNLSCSAFSGRIPFQLGNLSLLRYLDLGRNSLLGPVPFQIGNLRQLQYLHLGRNALSGEVPFQLGNLNRLQYLDLGGNYLSGEIPFQLSNINRLEYLNLGGNFLSGAIPFQLSNLNRLQDLHLGWNFLSGAIPFQLTIPFRNGNLPNLQTLRLSGDFDIEAEDSQWLSNLHFLTSLKLGSLHNLSSSRQWLQAISELIPNLVELRLVDCSLSDTNIKSLFHPHSNVSTSLAVLDLSFNVLTSSTFQLLFNFSLYLQELYFTDNDIALSTFLYPNFPSLNILDLSRNNLTALVFGGNFNFGSKLRELYLYNCSLTDQSFPISFASTINSSSSLVILNLSFNLLKSSTVFYWLLNCTTNLQTLYLYNNILESPIPEGFGKVMNYKDFMSPGINYKARFRLSLETCADCGPYPSEITSLMEKFLISFKILRGATNTYFRGNFLNGDVTESHLFNFSNLDVLSLSYNSLSVKFVSTWIPPFQVTQLDLASCELGPSFPGWLQTQNSLMWLDISDNELNDSVPAWFWNNLQNLIELNMSHNNLNGAIPDMPLKLPYTPSIILNSNQFKGAIPSFLQQASELLFSKNKFSDLCSLLSNQITTPNLATLDLSNNQIKGQIPDCWQSLNRLLFLDLSNNEFSGNIPISMGNLVKLEVLVIRKNNLTGELPSSLKNCTNLIMLDVGENKLSGPIPSWLGESLQQIIILNMQGNIFSEHFPIELCYLRYIQLLNLSRNKLSKVIPACLKNFTAMSEKSINRSEIEELIYGEIYDPFMSFDYRLDIAWIWKGVEQVFRDPQMKLKSIDLSCNDLSGEIPKEVASLVGLVSLNLSSNNLSGEIPFGIGNLSSLESLDLSRNHLYGRIPSLSQLDFLGKLNLSYNSLSGRIPLGRHLQTFEGSSFEGNINLCGEQRNKSCPGDYSTAKTEAGTEKDGDDSVFYEALYMSMGMGFFIGFWGLLGQILIWKPWRIAYLRFLNKLTHEIQLR
ncbi:hypothetical protein V8G54_013254 [Vigna mungo]|uniref:Leucine-rich repeat-containing N-terminal plant-type domain-containing protein n=1 Tax=Vigna mungo TaxID=3915 RepID=A0AAQ3NUD2_VIGMU